jgi:hypothetical protein
MPFFGALPVMQESDPGQDINGHNISGADGGASTGPVLLLHLPLYRADDNACTSIDLPRCAPWHDLEGSCLKVGSAPPLYVLQPFCLKHPAVFSNWGLHFVPLCITDHCFFFHR